MPVDPSFSLLCREASTAARSMPLTLEEMASTISSRTAPALEEAAGAIRPPDPLPPALRDAIAAVARDTGYASDWINTTVADQWRFGLPPDLARDLEWRTYGGGLTVGIVSRRTLVYFKLYASADQTTPDNVHTKDLLALAPSDAELEAAAAWVRTQDAGTDFHAVVEKVVDYVRAALR